MRKLLVLLLLLGCSPAFAALTVVAGPSTLQGNPPANQTFGSSVPSGSVIVKFIMGPGCSTDTVSDNVNSGNYTLMVTYATGGANGPLCIYYKVTNATGTPTVSMTAGGYSYTDQLAIEGFTGTPTIDVGIQAHNTGTSSTQSINATSNFNNEVMLVANDFGTSNITVSGANYTPDVSGTWAVIGYSQIEATPTTKNYSATLAASTTWFVQLAGVYDATGSSCTHAGYTSGGASTVPTSGVTSVWLKTGSFGTVNCSSTNYWQPALGNFGVN